MLVYRGLLLIQEATRTQAALEEPGATVDPSPDPNAIDDVAVRLPVNLMLCVEREDSVLSNMSSLDTEKQPSSLQE